MMRYRLRTLLIALTLGPPVLAATWWAAHDPASGALAIVLGSLPAAVVCAYISEASREASTF
jgi:hypothetical protein